MAGPLLIRSHMRGRPFVLPVATAVLAIHTIAGPLRGESGEALFRAQCARCHGDSGTACTALGRALKAAPLENDSRLARMTTAELMRVIQSDAKHRGVLHLGNDDLREVAKFVKHLAGRKGSCTPRVEWPRGESR